MRRRFNVAALLVISPRFLAAAEMAAPDFSRYAILIEKAPFSVAASAAATPPATPQSRPITLRLSAIVLDSQGRWRVGLVDKENERSLFLAPGESEDNIEVVAVNASEESVTIRRGSETAVLRLQSAPASATGAGTPSVTPLTADRQRVIRGPPWRRGSEAFARIRAAQAEAAGATERPAVGREDAPTGPPSREEIERRLQEIQMDAIRRGLPPLPVPLTPEMDEQLVREGVLPPQ